MVMRELMHGEREACRQRAVVKIIALTAGFNGLNEEQTFERTFNFFNCAKNATAACNENFELDKFIERENFKKSWEELRLLMIGGQQGIHLMENTCNLMEGASLSRINGTSLLFNGCVKVMESLKQEYGENITNVIRYMQEQNLQPV